MALGGNLTVQSGGELHDVGTLSAGDVTVAAGGLIASERVSSLLARDVSVSGTVTANIVSGRVANLTVAAGGAISANGLGFPGVVGGSGTGPGGGQGVDTGGGGGSHAGLGGVAGNGTLVGSIYGTASMPTTPGSSGGGELMPSVAGGAGGGVLKLFVRNALVVDGAITANGAAGAAEPSNAPGGGAGGSVWLFASNVTGSGVIAANGGAGGLSGDGGGGGGGGYVALYYGASAFAGMTTVAPGQPGSTPNNGTPAAGATGSLYVSQAGVGCLLGTCFQRVFATSTTRAGNFGSASAANAACTSLAMAQGLSGTWRAIVSTSVNDASTAVTAGLPWFNFAGDALSAGGTGAPWGQVLAAPVRYTERLSDVTGGVESVWTGTATTGAASASTCGDWAGSGLGTYGSATATTAWLSAATDVCSARYRLYCVEQ